MKKLNCIICAYPLSKKIVELKEMPLTDEFIEKNKPSAKKFINDIKIYICARCGIVQNPLNFTYKSYYKNYSYSSNFSKLTKNFMHLFAKATLDAFKKNNGRKAKKILEIGSGDGGQLLQYKYAGIKNLLGIEPSKYLSEIANKKKIKTKKIFFNSLTTKNLKNFDICLSSYTFDHINKPLDYLLSSYNLLNYGGILAIEIHDLKKIVDRNEFCLFEHEHKVYLSANDIRFLLENSGFRVISINPIKSDKLRANSLIVLAKKIKKKKIDFNRKVINSSFKNLQRNIFSLIKKIDEYISNLPINSRLVGFGAGGRGVMTIAALKNYKRIIGLLDSNYSTNKYFSPKTRIPIIGKKDWKKYKDCFCIVFSFGYYKEIMKDLISNGFSKRKIISLSSFF